jgi:outer membrane protein assembly factor BamB
VRDGPPLADAWGDDGPARLWSVELGEGHAGAAVRNGRVYVLDYDEQAHADALRCLSLDDGREIWRRAYEVRVKRNHGMSRTVPAVTDDFVVTMGPLCHVTCVRADSGEFVWGLDLVREFDTKVPLWYTAQCPVIDDGTAVIAPAGEVLMMGVDGASGEVLWQTPNPHEWEMSHSSVVPAVIHGRRMYVYCAIGGMVGVSAEEADRGTILWEASQWDRAVVAPSPVVLPDGRIFVPAGYGGGSMMVRIERTESGFAAKELYTLTPRQGLACEQQTPVLYAGYLYGILPKDGGALRNQLVCFDPEGTVVWNSGKTERFGLGPYLAADGKLFVLDDDGTLTLVRTSAEGYEVLDRRRILDGRDAWAPMALAADRLILRDSHTMVCLDVGD